MLFISFVRLNFYEQSESSDFLVLRLFVIIKPTVTCTATHFGPLHTHSVTYSPSFRKARDSPGYLILYTFSKLRVYTLKDKFKFISKNRSETLSYVT